MTSDTTPEKPASFEIRTLGDIFKLPTKEQMETCLEEIGRGMIQARSMSDLMLATVAALGGTPPEMALEWPEVMTWTDDKKGQVTTRFSDGDSGSGIITLVTTKKAP